MIDIFDKKPSIEMYDYQKTKIYDPIIEAVSDSLSNKSDDKLANFLQLSTSAGKTFTSCNFVIPELITMGLDIVYTVPNSAAISEVEEMILQSTKNLKNPPLVFSSHGFAGGVFEMPMWDYPGQRLIVVCHPTFVSMNLDIFTNFCSDREVVAISDEAHKGFSCPELEHQQLCFGYGFNWNLIISDDERENRLRWFKSFSSCGFTSWFLISATPLAAVFISGDHYKIISKFMDREVLCKQQKGVKSVTFYNGDSPLEKFENINILEAEEIIDHSGYMKLSHENLFEYGKNARVNSNIIEKIEKTNNWLTRVTEKYDLPKTKPATIIQSNSSEKDAPKIFENMTSDNIRSAVAVSNLKSVSGFKMPNTLSHFGSKNPTSNQILEFVGKYSNDVRYVVANKIVSEAISLRNTTVLVSNHARTRNTDNEVTAQVEQLLGRLLRFPVVQGIRDWQDVYNFSEKKISEGVPESVMERWIEVVFMYDIHMIFSPINVSGTKKFLNTHTYDVLDFKNYIKKFKMISAMNRMPRNKTYQTSRNNSEYKWYRDANPSCEVCPKNENGIPVCEAHYHGRVSMENLKKSRHVHHINGDHTNNNPDNLITICEVIHFDISMKEGHFNNHQYRPIVKESTKISLLNKKFA